MQIDILTQESSDKKAKATTKSMGTGVATSTKLGVLDAQETAPIAGVSSPSGAALSSGAEAAPSKDASSVVGPSGIVQAGTAPPNAVSGTSSTATTQAQSTTAKKNPYQNRDFKIVFETKVGNQCQQLSLHLVAPTVQEKAAWVSDISQCLDQVQFHDMLRPSLSETGSITLPSALKNDPKLFRDEADIRFSRTLNSCKVPQIRYATPERLLERLTGK